MQTVAMVGRFSLCIFAAFLHTAELVIFLLSSSDNLRDCFRGKKPWSTPHSSHCLPLPYGLSRVSVSPSTVYELTLVVKYSQHAGVVLFRHHHPLTRRRWHLNHCRRASGAPCMAQIDDLLSYLASLSQAASNGCGHYWSVGLIGRLA
jgi:hypothetical protein